MTMFILFLLAVNLLGITMLMWVHGDRGSVSRRNPCDMCGTHQRELHQHGAMMICDLCDQFVRRHHHV